MNKIKLKVGYRKEKESRLGVGDGGVITGILIVLSVEFYFAKDVIGRRSKCGFPAESLILFMPNI